MVICYRNGWYCCSFRNHILFTRSTRQKIGSSVTSVFFIIMAVALLIQGNSIKRAINSGSWEVHTDVVDRVMESTDSDGDKDYFMVLENHGRVSLDDYNEASQYYSGQSVYIIVVPKGGGYKYAGVTYSTDDYVYVGNHKK